ncbi:MAG TPA: hypothetical protein VFU31_05155 [Candidatus Binatia bacterium]|nr:hypothetical protein [Candidatus Binatia bacterium]
MADTKDLEFNSFEFLNFVLFATFVVKSLWLLWLWPSRAVVL